MDRVRLPGSDIKISALCLGAAEIGVRQTQAGAYRLKRSLNNGLQEFSILRRRVTV